MKQYTIQLNDKLARFFEVIATHSNNTVEYVLESMLQNFVDGLIPPGQQKWEP